MTLKRIGKITGPVGLAGEVKVKLYNPDASWLKKGDRLAYINSETDDMPAGYLVIEAIRSQAELAHMRFQDVTTRNASEALAGKYIAVYPQHLPVLENDEFYIDALRGLQVKSVQSQAILGEITDILSADAGAFLEMSLAENPKHSALIPFRAPFVERVDLGEKTLYLSGLDDFIHDEAIENEGK